MNDASDDHDEAEARDAADAVYAALLARIGEGSPRPRLAPTRRAVELLGDPHHAAPVIHITGTNGKTSTSRMIESLLRASGLRTGLLTSPHLERFTERIRIDGEPIADEAVARNWEEIHPFVAIVDAELEGAGEEPLTFFEALTVLAFACFADAPVDVVVLEVGMGGEWDSTNVADGQVAVFTPIDLDHQSRLGIDDHRDRAHEVGHHQADGIRRDREAARRGARGARGRGRAHRVDARRRGRRVRRARVAGRRGRPAGVDPRTRGGVPRRGAAAVRSPPGRERRGRDRRRRGVHRRRRRAPRRRGRARRPRPPRHRPGRLQPIAADPTVIVDAAHNPHGAESLVAALDEYFDFDEVVFVFGVLADKDAEGIVAVLARTGGSFLVTRPDSERARDAADLAAAVAARVGADRVQAVERLDDALDDARAWAAEAPKRAVVVTGSIALVGEAMAIAADRGLGSRMSDATHARPRRRRRSPRRVRRPRRVRCGRASPRSCSGSRSSSCSSPRS